MRRCITIIHWIFINVVFSCIFSDDELDYVMQFLAEIKIDGARCPTRAL